MTSKERVHAALRREPVDRVPIFMWYHPDTAARLAVELGLPAACVSEVMGDDIRQAWVGNNHAMEGIVHEHDGESHVDAWGVEWVKEGPFNQIRCSPLCGVPDEAALSYEYPYGQVEELLSNMAPVMAEAERLFVGCDVSPCLFEMVCRLRGMEQGLLDLAGPPELCDRLLDQACEFSVRMSEEACRRFALDWLWTGDDVGGQQCMMMSPPCWRERIAPRLERIFAVGKAHGLWLAYHSCGAIRPIIPDLVELGLDVLNPVQCNCPGMDPLELKREFGGDLAFMGGVDTQGLLPTGTPAEVYRETRRLVEGMTSDGGGYILAASHAVPPETPLASIFAMVEAAGVTLEEIRDRAASVRQLLATWPAQGG